MIPLRVYSQTAPLTGGDVIGTSDKNRTWTSDVSEMSVLYHLAIVQGFVGECTPRRCTPKYLGVKGHDVSLLLSISFKNTSERGRGRELKEMVHDLGCTEGSLSITSEIISK